MPVNYKVNYPNPDMIVCWLKSKQDRDILLNYGWYRIPVSTNLPDLHRVKYLSFYQSHNFGKESLVIKHYGTIDEKTIVKRKVFFPKEKKNEKSELDYFIIQMKDMNIRKPYLYSKRRRGITFISTTKDKFLKAAELNDLFHQSPLEDNLWMELKKNNIETERQYYTKAKTKYYILDFVAICKKGKIDIECDGASYHKSDKKIIEDNERDIYLKNKGWSILRYSTDKLNNMDSCVADINKTIYDKGGPESEENLNKFYNREKRIINSVTTENKTIYSPFSEKAIILKTIIKTWILVSGHGMTRTQGVRDP